jgi:methyl-accepting chemotaxis protein
MSKYKRRNYFIDRKLQTKYIVLTILLLLTYTLLFVLILFTPYIVPLYIDYPLEEQTKAARMLLTLHKTVWPALGAVILTMSTLSIFITHKIAGPVYHFRKVLAEVSGGNLDISIKLREKDDLKELAEHLNMVIREQRMFVHTLRGDHETISACINELEEKIKSTQISTETGEVLLEKMQARRETINQALAKYAKPV